MRASTVTTFLAGVGLLIPASLGLLVAGVPTKLCPLPLLTIIPAFVLSTWRLHYAAVTVPMILFFLWHPGLFHGEIGIPRRSYALVAGATLLSVLYFISGWRLGLEYQGAEHTRFVCVVNIAWVAFLIFAFGRTWKSGTTFWTGLMLHWAVFAWLAWYAFPYLGELP